MFTHGTRWHFVLVLLSSGGPVVAAQLEWVRVADDKPGFVMEDSGTAFVPWGFNYDHDGPGRLIEDYWDDEWPAIEEDFREMKQLGANVVRIHLQFGKFMDSPAAPNKHSLGQLERLVDLAGRVGLYLDLTGLGCYHKKDVPPWYDELDEPDRWAAQAAFWEAVAARCADSPAVFCYDLMNEPVVPGGSKKRDDWLGPAFAGKHFVQFITLEARGRPRHEIAARWIERLVAAVRKHDRKHLVTVGLVPWSLDRPGLTSGFVPEKVTQPLDFVAVHLYPQTGEVDQAIETLRGFAVGRQGRSQCDTNAPGKNPAGTAANPSQLDVGKPIVIEETFPLKCSAEELGKFIDQSQGIAAGWIGFYWGKTPDEYRPPKTFGEAATLRWLELFQEKRPGKQQHQMGNGEFQ